MAPSERQVKVAIEALRTDTKMWAAASDELREAAQIGGRLDLDALHFSYIGDKVGLTEIYHKLQDRLCRLLAEGSDNLQSLATALHSAADGYEQDEANAVHRFTGIY